LQQSVFWCFFRIVPHIRIAVSCFHQYLSIFDHISLYFCVCNIEISRMWYPVCHQQKKNFSVGALPDFMWSFPLSHGRGLCKYFLWIIVLKRKKVVNKYRCCR
jgi:hypothetical protein